MKFDIGKKELLEALRSVEPAVATRSTLPILAGVKLEAVAGRIALEATDLEFAIRLQARAETSEGHGRAVVPAKNLIKAVKAIAGSTVTVEFHDEEGRPSIEVACEKKRVTIEAFPVKDWPEITADIEWKPLCGAEGKDLGDILTRIVLCASTDDARPVLTGVQFNMNNEEKVVEAVATDSYRLGLARLDIEPMGEMPDKPLLVSARVLKALAKQLKNHDGRAILYQGTTGNSDRERLFVEFSFGGVNWIVRQIEGDFPNWRQLMPGDSGSNFDYDSKELVSAVKSASELRSQKNVPVRITLGDSCVLRMVEGQTATATETLDRATYSADGVGPMEMAFNPDYLLDAVTFLGEERGSMRAVDASKPALFVGDSRRYVLMPVRLP